MEFDMKKMINVTNRSAGRLVYRIPDRNIRREFNVGETKQLPYEELVWLSNQPGGRNMMTNLLQISDATVTKKLDIHTELEYFMSEAQIINMLQNGSVDELLDALDFAPTGVIEIIKTQAVQLPLYDMRKREAIKKAIGFDVTAAIENSAPDTEDVAEEASVTTGRRVQKTTEPAAPTRRYKVIEE